MPSALHRAAIARPLLFVSNRNRHCEFEDLLLPTTNNQYFWIGRINVDRSLLLPADVTGHVPIIGGNLGELFQFLGDGMHVVDLPASLGEDCVDHGRCKYELRLKRHDKLQLSKVWVWSGDIGPGIEEFEVGGLGSREEVGSSLQNCRLEVESPVVPGEGQLVAPDAWS